MYSLQTPKITLIWLNYNSIHVINLIKDSLRSLVSSDYPNYEVILVDNCSTDGSYETISQLFKTDLVPVHPDSRLLRMDSNLGFTGGMNAGFKARDRSSKYVAVVNNDAVITKNSVRVIVDELEKDERIGAAQGIVLNPNRDEVDSCGFMVDEILTLHFPYNKFHKGNLKKANVSFVEGTYPVYRISAIQQFLTDALFVPEGVFYFLEDVFNGLMLWNLGYRCVVLPFIAATHQRASSTSKDASLNINYFFERNKIAVLDLTNSRYKRIARFWEMRYLIGCLLRGRNVQNLIRALRDGTRLGKILKTKYGFNLDLYKAPILSRGPLFYLLPPKIYTLIKRSCQQPS